MTAAAAEHDPDIALALVCAVADTLVVPVFMQLLQPHEHLIGMYARLFLPSFHPIAIAACCCLRADVL
jgi:hypothetical protein